MNIRRLAVASVAICLGAALPSYAQETGSWRRVGESAPASDAAPASDPAPAVDRRVPSDLTLAAGTWLRIRVNEPLSSDHNVSGDTFTATLTQPLIANGYVVARRGQTVAGRVADAVKAGRNKGTSRLALELTEVSLVDGQNLPVKTQLMEYAAGTSKGRDATAVVAGTGVGAAIGGAASGGFGAGIGAIVGAAASTAGVLATRGRATEVYPEAVLTFRTLEPLTIATDRSGHAFEPVRQSDYDQRQVTLRSRPTMTAPPYYYGGFYYPYYYPYYSPYFWGPSFYFYSGPRFHGGFRHHR